MLQKLLKKYYTYFQTKMKRKNFKIYQTFNKETKIILSIETKH